MKQTNMIPMEPDLKDTTFGRDAMLVFTSGIYSGYYLHGLYRVVKPFSMRNFTVVNENTGHRPREEPDVPRLITEGYVEAYPYTEMWME